jgi:hypothetical protein
MRRVLVLAAVGEAATGLALLIVPSLVGRLLLGEELTGVAIPVARVLGIALIALGVACRPGTVVSGMLTYSALTALYLLYLGIQGNWAGPLLWPAVALHAVLTLLLMRSCWWPSSARPKLTEEHLQNRQDTEATALDGQPLHHAQSGPW